MFMYNQEDDPEFGRNLFDRFEGLNDNIEENRFIGNIFDGLFGIYIKDILNNDDISYIQLECQKEPFLDHPDYNNIDLLDVYTYFTSTNFIEFLTSIIFDRSVSYDGCVNYDVKLVNFDGQYPPSDNKIIIYLKAKKVSEEIFNGNFSQRSSHTYDFAIGENTKIKVILTEKTSITKPITYLDMVAYLNTNNDSEFNSFYDINLDQIYNCLIQIISMGAIMRFYPNYSLKIEEKMFNEDTPSYIQDNIINSTMSCMHSPNILKFSIIAVPKYIWYNDNVSYYHFINNQHLISILPVNTDELKFNTPKLLLPFKNENPLVTFENWASSQFTHSSVRRCKNLGNTIIDRRLAMVFDIEYDVYSTVIPISGDKISNVYLDIATYYPDIKHEILSHLWILKEPIKIDNDVMLHGFIHCKNELTSSQCMALYSELKTYFKLEEQSNLEIMLPPCWNDTVNYPYKVYTKKNDKTNDNKKSHSNEKVHTKKKSLFSWLG